MSDKILNFVCKYFVFYMVLCYSGGFCQDFGYDGDEGPSNWGTKYSQCIGKRQSPIDIQTSHVKAKSFPPIKYVNFQNILHGVTLENNGHTAILSAKGIATSRHLLPQIYGGPLETGYIFQQLHFHWGPNDTVGSENLIDGASFPLEIHVVFYNEIYANYDQALKADNGLTVLSFLCSISNRDNEKYDKFAEGLLQIHPLSSNKSIPNFVPLNYLITEDRHNYFTYQGSLTTPPCLEIVTWIEFEKTVPISRAQINSFRSLSSTHGLLTHNYRPVQPINNRTIYYNAAEMLCKANTLLVTLGLLMYLVLIIY